MTEISEIDKQRFFSRVQKSKGCWEWTGARKGSGYGVFCLYGKARPAHRISFAIANPGTEEDMLDGRKHRCWDYILHSCDNPSCVNPAHLRRGSATDNARDRIERHRTQRWDRTKLTPEIIDALRAAKSEDELAALKYQHRISDAVAHGVVTGKTFKWYKPVQVAVLAMLKEQDDA